MRKRVLSETKFKNSLSGWAEPNFTDKKFCQTPNGLLVDAKKGSASLDGSGVQTRNGDEIALHFTVLEKKKGQLRFGFSGGMESAVVTLDFAKGMVSLNTSDWTAPQPQGRATFDLGNQDVNVLRIEKTEGGGNWVKLANIQVILNDYTILKVNDINVLPELGVRINVSETRVLLKRFVHRGVPSNVPEYLHVGGWQALNQPSLSDNLDSLCRGLAQAADKGVQLLLTPETSLTGLFPTHKVTQDPKPVSAAEKKLRAFIRSLKNAPYVVVGLPLWQEMPGHRRKKTRYNVSRVYDPDGEIVHTGPKIHSCETEFWHGYGLHELDIYGAPVCMHICHDGRYPETWTLPVMFGARLILHPSNGGHVRGSVDAFESGANRTTSTSHAFYLRVNGGGGSCLVSPSKFENVLAVSSECRRTVSTFPMVGPPEACLFDKKIRLHDAFGYWPKRSFRASESVAEAYVSLYRARGGTRM
jgi:predicted amidohydrolase